MSASRMGAKVMYCGHDGWFMADVFRVGNANVVKASGEGTAKNAVSAKSIVRGRNEEATHLLLDFPKIGAWMPERGVFVVLASQVREI